MTTSPTPPPSDAGAFAYRGIMVDLARHFLPLADLYTLISAMSALRLNTLHLHLSDDQGWRFESKTWPKLTTLGSTRSRTVVGRPGGFGDEDAHPESYKNTYDDAPHGGFYTQAELRALVQHAHDHGVQLVPEIDMPGHMRAARAAYPELGYDGVPWAVGESWGVYREVLRVDALGLRFAKDILGEICDVFSHSKYVHIGGDECPKTEWADSHTARKQVADLGLDPDSLASYDKLQRWFTGQLALFLGEKGRTLVGWDEILDGGVPGDGNCVVMAWRDWTDAAGRATALGVPVIQTPSLLYFDYAQGPEAQEPLALGPGSTLEQVYNFDPYKGVAQEKRGLILGTQAQLWREYIPTTEHLWYMMFPRLVALADVAWFGEKRMSYEEFLEGLPARMEELGKLGIVGHPLPGK